MYSCTEGDLCGGGGGGGRSRPGKGLKEPQRTKAAGKKRCTQRDWKHCLGRIFLAQIQESLGEWALLA